MKRYVSICLIPLVALSWAVRPAAADQKEAEESLKAKGLVKRATAFCLADETELTKLLAASRQGELGKKKRALDETQGKANAAKSSFDDMETQFKKMKQEYEALHVQVQAMPAGSSQRNKLIDRHNYLVAILETMPGRLQTADKAVAETRKSAAELREGYIQQVMKLRQKYDALDARYQELAEDAGVTKALEEYNEGQKRPFTLGPLRSTTDMLKKLEADVISESIPIHDVHGNWHTFVTINDRNPPLEMILDTGASICCLPYKTAESVGMTPDSESPQITCKLADGRPVVCRLMTAETMRLGKFEIKNVKIAIMPMDCTEAAPLLGMSYLNNFTFKLDKTKALLSMSLVEDQGKGPATRGGPAGKRTAASKTAEAARAKEEPKDEPATPADQMVKLLAMDGNSDTPSEGNLTFRTNDNKEIVFRPTKRGPAKALQQKFGEPDEMRKMPAPRSSGDDNAPPWKLWTWGSIHVLVDDSGNTRYIHVDKEKEKE